MKANPEYKGEWKAKRISNPAYKGVWAPKKIANPEYSEDKELYLMSKKDLGFIGFDLWQVKGGSLFDNIIVSVDSDEAALVKEADEAAEKFKTFKAAQTDAKSKTTTTTTTTTATETDASETDMDDDGETPGDKKDDDDL